MPSPTITSARGSFQASPAIVGRMLLGQADHLAVDLDHHRALDAAVLQHPAQHAAIAGADDQHALGRAMRQQRHMRQHLLVDELVAPR